MIKVQVANLSFFLVVLVLSQQSSALKLEKPAVCSSPLDESLIKKFQPIFYLDENELYFPIKIEWMKLNWPSDPNTKEIPTNYKGPHTFKAEAPVYVSYQANAEGTDTKITYAIIFGIDACGPSLHAEAKAFGYGPEKNIELCPGGNHWFDVEHVDVFLNKEHTTVTKMRFSQLQKTIEIKPEQIEWIDNNPIFFIARGSHSLYTEARQHLPITFWNKKGMGYKTYADYIDYTSRAFRWKSPDIRVLKVNANKADGLSNDEEQLAFNYKGKIGTQYDNDPSYKLKFFLNDLSEKISSISSKLSKEISTALDKIDKILRPEPVGGLATRKWF